MNNEIKEIIKFQDILNYYKAKQIEPTYCEELITTGELQYLLDYITNLQNQLEEKTYLYNKLDTESKYVITNLQEENKELNLELSGYRKAILNDDNLLDLKSRIDKAIEYIKKNYYTIDIGDVVKKDLLNILGGKNEQ